MYGESNDDLSIYEDPYRPSRSLRDRLQYRDEIEKWKADKKIDNAAACGDLARQ